MNFYNNTHPYYCGIDLHARTLYVCIIDQQGETCVHKEIPDDAERLKKLLEPYLGNVVVGVECMHCWYWLADFCEEQSIDFILGHALYMKAIHGGKAKNDRIDSYKIANLMRGETSHLLSILRRCELHLICFDDEWKLYVMVQIWKPILPTQQAKQHKPVHLHLLKSIKGVGQILSLTIIYEIGDINRFESVQKFASYARLVKCKAESAGKSYGTSGNKIGNAHPKWAFSQAAVLHLRGNKDAQKYLLKLQKRMPKSKALSALAHKLGRSIYFMLKNETVFDEAKFFKR